MYTLKRTQITSIQISEFLQVDTVVKPPTRSRNRILLASQKPT